VGKMDNSHNAKCNINGLRSITQAQTGRSKARMTVLP